MMLKLLDIVRKQAKEAQAQGFLAQGRLLLVYKELLTPITGLLDWKQEDKKPKGAACSKNCDNTLALCGHCLSDSVPGNIMYGFMSYIVGILPRGQVIEYAREKGIRPAKPYAPGSYYSTTGPYSSQTPPPRGVPYYGPKGSWYTPWPAWDKAAVELGIGHVKEREGCDFCCQLEEVLDQLQRPDEKECASAEPCSFL